MAPADCEDALPTGANYPVGDNPGQRQFPQDRDGDGRGVRLRLGLHGGIQPNSPTISREVELKQSSGRIEPSGNSQPAGYVCRGPKSLDTSTNRATWGTSSSTNGITPTTPRDCGGSDVHVSARTSSSIVSGPEGGPQLSETLLAVQQAEADAVRVLPMAELPTSLEATSMGWETTREDLRQGAREDCGSMPPGVQTRDHLEGRDQCLPGDGPMCGVRRDPLPGEDQAGRRGGPEEEEFHQVDCQTHQEDGVRAVSGMEGFTGEAKRNLEGSGRSMSPTCEWEQSGKMAAMSKREKKLQRQAQASLKKAESMWQDLMTLVGDSCLYSGDFSVDHLQTPVSKDSAVSQCKKSAQRWTNVLGRGCKKHLVSEVFNPNRFKQESNRCKLDHGRAFDLTLGDNLLTREGRNDVRHYLKTNKPGLTVISPPCTLYTVLQNLNQKHLDNPEKLKEYLRRVTEARVLMRFGIEICELVAGYGGSFLFEQPQTSRAWKEPFVVRLTEELQNFVVTCDQCMFDLRSVEGQLHKKPTKWLTNNEHIAQALQVRCDHKHQHVPVLGSGPGGSRSSRAQEYPPLL